MPILDSAPLGCHTSSQQFLKWQNIYVHELLLSNEIDLFLFVIVKQLINSHRCWSPFFLPCPYPWPQLVVSPVGEFHWWCSLTFGANIDIANDGPTSILCSMLWTTRWLRGSSSSYPQSWPSGSMWLLVMSIVNVHAVVESLEFGSHRL